MRNYWRDRFRLSAACALANALPGTYKIEQMTSTPLILALDIGTSSVRASVYDRFGDLLDGIETRTEYRMTVTADGGVEIDAETMFAMVVNSIDQSLALLGKRAVELAA